MKHDQPGRRGPDTLLQGPERILARWASLCGMALTRVSRALSRRTTPPLRAEAPRLLHDDGVRSATALDPHSVAAPRRRPAGYRVSLPSCPPDPNIERWRRPPTKKPIRPVRDRAEATQRLLGELQRLCICNSDERFTQVQRANRSRPTGPSTSELSGRQDPLATANDATEAHGPTSRASEAVRLNQLAGWRPSARTIAAATRPLETIARFKYQLVHAKLAYGQVMLDLHTRNKLMAMMNASPGLEVHGNHLDSASDPGADNAVQGQDDSAMKPMP